MIYALVRGLRPRCALEIGVRWGGSARIICAAMETNGEGRCVGLDPDVSNFRVPTRRLYGRYELYRGSSPTDVPQAAACLDGRLDFVFIDAMHIYTCALADLRAVRPLLKEGAHILLHDCFHVGIDAAVGQFLEENPIIEDCGILTRHSEAYPPILGQGLRLLRVGGVESKTLLETAYHGQFPTHPEHLWDYDHYALRVGLVRKVNSRYEYASDS